MTTVAPVTAPPARRRLFPALAAVALAVVLTTTACPGNVHHTYRTFESAVDRGASCEELFNQRARFNNEDTLGRIDAELARIGCSSTTATRNDH